MVQKTLTDEYQTKSPKYHDVNDKREPYKSCKWKLVNLDVISRKITDGTHDTPEKLPDGYPLITSKNLSDNGKINKTKISYISHEDYTIVNKRSKVDKNDLLLGMIGTIGNPVIVSENDLPFAIKNVALIKPKNENILLSKFMYYFFKSPLFIKQVRNRGSIQKFISLTFLRKELRIPVPFKGDEIDYEEIENIVTKIGVFFQKINSVEELRYNALEKTYIIFDSILNKIFKEAENSEGWNIVKLEEILVDKPQYGYTTSAVNKKTDIKLLRITDIQNNEILWDKIPYCEVDKDVTKYLLKKDEIVFARTGSTTGKTCIIKKEIDETIIFASYLVRIKPNQNIVYSDFLNLFFKSQYYWKQIQTRGGIKPNFNATKLRKIVVPLCSRDRQREIVSYLESINNEIKQLEQLQESQLQKFIQLRESILDKAFKGQL